MAHKKTPPIYVDLELWIHLIHLHAADVRLNIEVHVFLFLVTGKNMHISYLHYVVWVLELDSSDFRKFRFSSEVFPTR